MTKHIKQARDALKSIEHHGDGFDEGACYGAGYDHEQAGEFLNKHYQTLLALLDREIEGGCIRQDSIADIKGLDEALESWEGICKNVNTQYQERADETVRIAIYTDDVQTLDLLLTAARELQRIKGVK